MAASLKTVQAIISADGIVTTAEPSFGPCVAVITLLMDERLPNAVTRAAMDEPTEAIDPLVESKPLPSINKDHPLVGNMKDYRECHVSGDWLLTY